MSFGKFLKKTADFIQDAGSVVGDVVQGGCAKLAEKTGIEEIRSVGNMAGASTAHTGKTLAHLTEGLGQMAQGLVQDDEQLRYQGLRQVGGTLKTTAQGLANGLNQLGDQLEQAVVSTVRGDYDQAGVAVKAVGLAVVASVISLGVVEMADVAEHSSPDLLATPDSVATHEVNPHAVEGYVRADGTVVEGYWRDGDGNTQVDLTAQQGGGYVQTNPDGLLSNNFSG